MAKKKQRVHRQDKIGRAVRKFSSIGAKVFIAGPVIFPAIQGAQQALQGNIGNAFPEFVYQASGYDMRNNALNVGQLQTVLVRDAALVGTGLFLRYVSRWV